MMKMPFRNEYCWVSALVIMFLLWILPLTTTILIGTVNNKYIVTTTSMEEDEDTVLSSSKIETIDIPKRRSTDRSLQKEQQQQQQQRTTIFYAIGDIPYTSDQGRILQQQMQKLIPNDGEFVIHVGDIRDGKNKSSCTKKEYQYVANLLRYSPVPVFIIPGDNEWNDCTNYKDAPTIWRSVFNEFEKQYWLNASAKFKVFHIPDRPENFRFIYRGNLFLGLNLVGGTIRNRTEWNKRLFDEYKWVTYIITLYQKITVKQKYIGRIVLFGHANPTFNHDIFFIPFRKFVSEQLKNRIPILYIHGDKHEWIYEPNYLGQSSILRISLVGLGKDPPLQISIISSSSLSDTFTKIDHAFQINRRL